MNKLVKCNANCSIFLQIQLKYTLNFLVALSPVFLQKKKPTETIKKFWRAENGEKNSKFMWSKLHKQLNISAITWY